MICNEIFRYLTEFHESSWRGERLIWTKEEALKLKTVSGKLVIIIKINPYPHTLRLRRS